MGVAHWPTPKNSGEHASSTGCSRGSASGQGAGEGEARRAAARSARVHRLCSPRPMTLPRVCGARGETRGARDWSPPGRARLEVLTATDK